MLIETLADEKDSVIVYSRNTLNAEENFSVLLKKDPLKVSRKLFLYDICGLINNPVPKNIIVYRLLSNIPDLTVTVSGLGCMIRIGDSYEIIYPDPIYAVKELENLIEGKYIPELRFRIQQVGLTTLYIEGDVHVFKELFQFDMNSQEAEAQNDTVFVEALLQTEDQEVPVTDEEDDHNFRSLITEDPELELTDSGNDLPFHSLAGLDPPPPYQEKGSGEAGKKYKSVIEIFKSAPTIKKNIKEKGKRIILKFKQKF
jgi:hypothetical protein